MTCSLTTWAPWTSIFRITSLAGDEGVADLVARRAVPVAVDLVRLEEAAVGALREELVAGHEVVVDAVDLAVPRRARRAGHDVVAVAVAAGLRLAPPERVDDRVLADPGRPRDDDQQRPGRAVDDARRPARVRRDVEDLVGHRRPAESRWSRSPSRTRSSSPGSGASARISEPLDGDVSSSRQAWRNSRSSGRRPARGRPGRAATSPSRRPGRPRSGGRSRRDGPGSGGSGR